MIELLMAAALAAETTGIPSRENLIQCLAYLAHGPEYASVSEDDLAHNETFMDAAERSYCSDEVSPFWKVAHQKARTKLNRPKGGPTSLEQQDLAEQEMKSILGEAWNVAREYRSHPNPLSPDRMTKFALAWLLNGHNSTWVGSLTMRPLECARVEVRASPALKPEDVMAGMASPAFKPIGNRCGYQAAEQALSTRLTARFPEMDATLANGLSSSFFGQMTFWAALSP